MFKSFLTSIKNECKLMAREKMIFIVIILIPVLINLLLGYEFQKNQIDHIPMAICDQDNSVLSRTIIQQFEDDNIFDVNYYMDDSLQMEKMFKESKIKVGMIIPKNFNKDVMALDSPSVLMIYDGSHMPTVSSTKAKASEILLTLKTGMSMKILSAKLDIPDSIAENIAQSIKFRSRTLYNPTKSYKNFLNTGFGTAVIQSGIALMAAVSIRRKELEKKRIKRIGYLFGKIVFYAAIGWISLALSIMIQNKIFNIPFRGNMVDAFTLSLLLSTSVATFSVMISSWIGNQMMALLANAIVFIPNTMTIGYTWPVMSMPKPYQVTAMLYPFYHYADNLRDMFLKGLTITAMQGDIIWYMKFIIIVLCIAILGVLRFKIEEGEKSVVS